jgi:hypothetical protein
VVLDLATDGFALAEAVPRSFMVLLAATEVGTAVSLLFFAIGVLLLRGDGEVVGIDERPEATVSNELLGVRHVAHTDMRAACVGRDVLDCDVRAPCS